MIALHHLALPLVCFDRLGVGRQANREDQDAGFHGGDNMLLRKKACQQILVFIENACHRATSERRNIKGGEPSVRPPATDTSRSKPFSRCHQLKPNLAEPCGRAEGRVRLDGT